MVRISVLGDALKTMYNAEKRGKVRWGRQAPGVGPTHPRISGCASGLLPRQGEAWCGRVQGLWHAATILNAAAAAGQALSRRGARTSSSSGGGWRAAARGGSSSSSVEACAVLRVQTRARTAHRGEPTAAAAVDRRSSAAGGCVCARRRQCAAARPRC
jgi:hypothetical protein